MNIRRARTIYVKELVDILRDRRTLAAMILAPIVLYPLLMLGGIQAASSQTENIKDERIVVGFEKEWQWNDVVRPLLEEERDLLTKQRAAAEARGADVDELAEIPVPLGEFIDAKSTAQLEASIREQSVHCGVIVLPGNDGSSPSDVQITLTIVTQKEQVRSEIAARRLQSALDRVGEHRRDMTLRTLNIDPRIVEPIVIKFRKLITPGSVLGLILPFILVLMTVTGAIYPAIDLTAGERERGTLETLMVCPVPVIDLIVGKFMAVTTIAIIAAALNIASVTATVYFGGLQEAMAMDPSAEGGDDGFPWWAFPVVLFTLIPFAVLMSAIMLAVCACARTFKEAQNYIMPVIMLVLVPGGIAALPGTKLEGVMIVVPVANMVLLTRDLLSGAALGASTFAWVLLSTSLYAAVSVAVAAQVFGKESVLFADSLSLRAMLSRRLIKPSRWPTLSGAGLYAATLFPIWFYVQSALQRAVDDDMADVLRWSAILMPVFFLGVPAAMVSYWKIDARATFRLGVPTLRHLAAAVLIGLAAWAPAHELFVLQEHYIATPPALAESNKALDVALTSMPFALAFTVIALVPAVCEEAFFRGFLLSGLRGAFRDRTAILFAAAAFAAFHFFIFRFPVTMVLGVVLGWLCLRSGSVWTAILMHALHNGVAVVLVRWPEYQTAVGLSATDPWSHLPARTLIPSLLALLVAWWIARRPDPSEATKTSPILTSSDDSGTL